MESDIKTLTKLHLKAFDLSDYTIKQLVRGLKAQSTKDGFYEYLASEVKAAVQARLSHSRIQLSNREKLQRVLKWLNGESNVIAVDFLKGLPPEKKLEVLYARIEELESQEQTLNEETAKLLAKAKRMIASH